MSYIEKFWRDATVSDLVKVMESETVEARFADDGGNWVLSKLRGWRSSSRVLDNWIDDDGARWDCCQVYDPPQWFLDKPEPGEGYRLLGKFPDEALQPEDEAVTVAGLWHESWQASIGGTQVEDIWYRRRIEQPKPEPKFAVGQRVRIIGGISGPYIGEFANIEAMTIEPTGWFYELRYVEGSFHEPNLEPVTPKHYSLQIGDTADVHSGHRLAVTEHGVEVT
jgi:hypothetical protein